MPNIRENAREETRMTEPTKVVIELDEIEIDEEGQTIKVDETIFRAMLDAKNKIAGEDSTHIVICIHSW
jgi:hypothetical protein